MKLTDKLRETAGRLINGAVEDGSVEVAMLCEAADEIERLRERLGPRGLEVVSIEGVGHYVNEKVKAEIERLRSVLMQLAKECVNPGDGGPYEAGEWPALDQARACIREGMTDV